MRTGNRVVGLRDIGFLVLRFLCSIRVRKLTGFAPRSFDSLSLAQDDVDFLSTRG